MPDSFLTSPLFKLAASAIRQQARREFARSEVGQMMAGIRRMKNAASNPERAVLQYVAGSRGGQLMRQLKNSATVGGVSQMIERYGKNALTRMALNEILNSLGPLGTVVRAVMNVSGYGPSGGHHGVRQSMLQRELRAAMGLLKAYGYEVTPPKGRRDAKDNKRAVEVAKKILTEQGYNVLPPTSQWTVDDANRVIAQAQAVLKARGQAVPPEIAEQELHDQFPQLEGRGLPFGISPTTSRGDQRKVIDVDMGRGKGSRRLPVDHPAVTGQRILTKQSSNVYSYRYDLEAQMLWVRYRAPGPADSEGGRAFVPGPLYEYRNVNLGEYMALMKAPSKGTWVWDNLRVRGTVAGYRKPYKLAGVTMGYVPRHARLAIGKQGLGEYYMPRSFRAGTKTLRSRLPQEMVNKLSPRQAARMAARNLRGHPNRGTPNRGR